MACNHPIGSIYHLYWPQFVEWVDVVCPVFRRTFVALKFSNTSFFNTYLCVHTLSYMQLSNICVFTYIQAFYIHNIAMLYVILQTYIHIYILYICMLIIVCILYIFLFSGVYFICGMSCISKLHNLDS